MKRLLLIGLALALTVSACLPDLPQSQNGATPFSDEDLRLTAAALSEQTLQALPTQSPPPSETPVIQTGTPTTTQPTPTETVNPVLLTLTATLLAGTPTPGTQTTVAETAGSETPVAESQDTQTPGGFPQPAYVGTQPPFLPSGTVQFANKADADVYVSLRCVTKGGHVTIQEYSVRKIFSAEAPAGNYTYVAWVGGRQFDGGFQLSEGGFVVITFFKNRITVKKE